MTFATIFSVCLALTILGFALVVGYVFFVMFSIKPVDFEEPVEAESIDTLNHRYDSFRISKVSACPGDTIFVTLQGVKFRHDCTEHRSWDRVLKVLANDGAHWVISDGVKIAPMEVVEFSGGAGGGGGGPK